MAPVVGWGLLTLGRLDPSTLTVGARGHSRAGGGLLWGRRAPHVSSGSTKVIQERKMPLLGKIQDKVVKDAKLRWMGLCRGAATAAPKPILDVQPEPPEAMWNRQVGRMWRAGGEQLSLPVALCSFPRSTLWRGRRTSMVHGAAVSWHTPPCSGWGTGTACDIHLFGVPRSCEDQNSPQP